MTDRVYTLPGGLTSALVGSFATMDEIELLARRSDALGLWATRTATGARRRVLDEYLGDDWELPTGLVASLGEGDDELDVVYGLVRGHETWGLAAGADPSLFRRMTLDDDEVAFVFRHLDSPVVLSPCMPLATFNRVDTLVVAAADLPDGALAYAVLDEVDRNAVLDLIAVSKGPKVQRRVNGEWHDDPTWASILRSPRPPRVSPVTGGLLDQVVSQVDESTANQDFEPTDRAKYVSTTLASARARADEVALELLPLIARGSLTDDTILGAMPPKLKKYWSIGKGAAKIRWGTPGAMTRCARYLRKYVPGREYQTCNNLSKPLGGKGVAWDVG